jgi:hypothetical protein
MICGNGGHLDNATLPSQAGGWYEWHSLHAKSTRARPLVTVHPIIVINEAVSRYHSMTENSL